MEEYTEIKQSITSQSILDYQQIYQQITRRTPGGQTNTSLSRLYSPPPQRGCHGPWSNCIRQHELAGGSTERLPPAVPWSMAQGHGPPCWGGIQSREARGEGDISPIPLVSSLY